MIFTDNNLKIQITTYPLFQFQSYQKGFFSLYVLALLTLPRVLVFLHRLILHVPDKKSLDICYPKVSPAVFSKKTLKSNIKLKETSFNTDLR